MIKLLLLATVASASFVDEMALLRLKLWIERKFRMMRTQQGDFEYSFNPLVILCTLYALAVPMQRLSHKINMGMAFFVSYVVLCVWIHNEIMFASKQDFSLGMMMMQSTTIFSQAFIRFALAQDDTPPSTMLNYMKGIAIFGDVWLTCMLMYALYTYMYPPCPSWMPDKCHMLLRVPESYTTVVWMCILFQLTALTMQPFRWYNRYGRHVFLFMLAAMYEM